MKKIMILATGLAVLAGCTATEGDYDATGTFEATETIVSAEENGTLTTFSVSEGTVVKSGSEVGLIDTTQLWLKIRQANATKRVYDSQMPDMAKQVAATRQQLAKALTEQQRYERLVSDGAAPSKMLDDATNQVKVLQKQLDAQTSTLSHQQTTLNSQQGTVDVQISQLRDQLRKCHITAPVSGTVLEKYVERGEYVNIGKPLFKVADVGAMYMRAYITSEQLKDIKVGQHVKVFADFGNDERREYDGTVTWISSRSEFTPKTILTNDERADLVYAMKVKIKNDGYVKIGMYGGVKVKSEK